MSDAMTSRYLDWTRNFTGVDIGGLGLVATPPASDADAGPATGSVGASTIAPMPNVGNGGASRHMAAPTGSSDASTPAAAATAAAAPTPGVEDASHPDTQARCPSAPTSAVSDEEAARIKKLADRIPGEADRLILLWEQSVSYAIAKVPAPQVDDPAASANFYRALAGNMLWAATSLFAEWQPIVITMSFVGAGMGSGLGAAQSKDQPPSPAPDIIQHVVQARDALSNRIRQQAGTIAADIIGGSAEGLNAEDEALWNRIFNNIPFNSQDALLAHATQMVTSAVKQYTDQWTSWVAATNKEADSRTAKVLAQTAGGRMPFGFVETVHASQLKQVRQEKPFSPVLKF